MTKNLLLIKKFSKSDKKIPQSWTNICNKYKLEFFRFSNISIISSYILFKQKHNNFFRI